MWAAKYAARHPNLVALELSSFKCGHDAPTYSLVEEIIEEMMVERNSERITRLIDHDQDSSMEQKKREGYF